MKINLHDVIIITNLLLAKNMESHITWYAVNDPRGLYPESWHKPTHDEWDSLTSLLEDEPDKKLKSISSWKDNESGSDSIGFSALPAGNVIAVDYLMILDIMHIFGHQLKKELRKVE